eukprot:Opistho-2@31091
MSAKAIREVDGKRMLATHLAAAGQPVSTRVAQVTKATDYDALVAANPWLQGTRLVAKPDQLIKRRGKLGLIKVNTDFDGAKQWIAERIGKDVSVGAASGVLDTFIIEPFVAHEATDEYYVCILSNPHSDEILFHHEGGVDIGDVDAKAVRLTVNVGQSLTADTVSANLLSKVPDVRRAKLAAFIAALYKVYVDLYFTYLEINPLVMVGDEVHVLDLAAKIDQTADFEAKTKWGGEIDFPPPFGREATPEEAYIRELDGKSGASLKLTILNRKGRIWTMVAGGGASVIYSDTICDLGFASEMANYGEYSGAPSESQTYEYAKTILELMTREKDPRGKRLIIGGGIANFTNVAATFKGIERALKEFQHLLIEHNIKIYVRRGGPNYQEGLRIMRDLGLSLGVPIEVYGPETHMTAIVAAALGIKEIDKDLLEEEAGVGESLMNMSQPRRKRSSIAIPKAVNGAIQQQAQQQATAADVKGAYTLFTRTTRAFVYGMQPRAVQGMLDFDSVCKRDTASVAGMIYPFSGNHSQKFYWGTKEIMIPVYKSMEEAMQRHPEADVMINFASFRSAYESTMETLQFPQIRVISIIAEGIPENKTRLMNKAAKEKGVWIIGPATVGGIKPGCFKIGNTGGMLDNIVSSRLYRPGSVAYVSRSGGMSNELNNIISRCTNGVYEGVAIGGDRYPGSTFIDHLLRFEDDPEVKMMVLLGEVGGTEEYLICEAIKNGRIKKPLIGWCIGTCADQFSSEVQFGHAGACANAMAETSSAKNLALKQAGAIVPDSFDSLGDTIGETYASLVKVGVIVERPEPDPPKVPIDYSWAQELGLIRKPASFVTSICDERGEELLYAGVPITAAFQEDIGIGGVVSLLWFKRRLPAYACKFIEMCLMVTADHGPAVSGAHNTIVTARAGKDLVSSLCSGLLTIGDRFGGALDDAAKQFSEAYDTGLSPQQFVDAMRKQHQLIMGVGHRIKSISNPDMRVNIIRDFCRKNFDSTPLLDFACQVELITTSKKPNLILNVDGCIAVCMVDLLRTSGCFTLEEANEYLQMGFLNGLFVLGRTVGFIGHYLDQKRLKQGLYRHPWDDISYVLPETQYTQGAAAPQ